VHSEKIDQRLRVHVVMEDTLLAEALVGYLGRLPHLLVHVTPTRVQDPVREMEAFGPQIILVDRHPSPEVLRLAGSLEMKVVVVSLQEQAATLYDVWHREVASMHDLAALIAEPWELQVSARADSEEEKAMRYARITYLYPLEGQGEEVRRLLDSYLTWLSQRPGFALGLSLAPVRGGNSITRVTVWEGQGWADATALSEHALAIRSQLIALTSDQAIHEEEFNVSALEIPGRNEGH